MTYDVTPLLTFIGKHESRNDPNAVWGGISKRHYPPKLLTTMTVGEVLNWQDSIDRLYMSEAAGEWQFLEDTLRDLVKQGRARLSDCFDVATQAKLATALLRRRGLDEYVAGTMSAERFANKIAREWASMPLVDGPNKGRSYYAGDGLNKSGVSVTAFLHAVKQVKVAPVTHETKTVMPAPVGPVTPFAALLGAIAAFFRKGKA